MMRLKTGSFGSHGSALSCCNEAAVPDGTPVDAMAALAGVDGKPSSRAKFSGEIFFGR
jgi:hypothetical protein